MSSAAFLPTPVTVGDLVTIHRNLAHPAWVGDEDLVVCTARITEIGSIYEKPGQMRVRASNGFWYECATGLQQHSGVTTIHPCITQD